MKKYLAHCMPITIAILLAACGGGGGSDDPPVTSIAPPTQPPVDGTNTPIPRTINGKLVMPNGNTPLSNGLVYLPKDASAAKTIVSQKMRHKPVEAVSVADGGCGTAPVPVIAQACTRSDGSFTFEATLPAAGFPLIAHKGVFTTQAQLTVGSDSTVTMEPVKIDVGNVKMAVVTGTFDHLELVLANIGFGEIQYGALLKYGTEKFDLYDDDGGLAAGYQVGSVPKQYPRFEELFVPRADGSLPLNDYDIVFINCGAEETLATQPSVVAPLLREYVKQGGRLYVTDRAYDFVEQALPEFIDFYGSDEVDEKDAEYSDVAEVGEDGLGTVRASFAANSSVDMLKAYLEALSCNGTSCVGADGTVGITGFLPSWAVINGVHPMQLADTKIWIEGPVTYASNDEGVKPLTVSFRFGDGMVMFSSYHTHSGVKLSAQERILEYLVFELE